MTPTYEVAQREDGSFGLKCSDGRIIGTAKTEAEAQFGVDVGTYLQEGVIAELLKLLKGVMESCLYAEDDGQIGVTMEPTLYPQQFDAICAAIKMAEGRS